MAQQVYIFNQGGGGEGRRYIPTRGSLPLECVGQRGHDFRTIDEERGVCNGEFRETVHRVSKSTNADIWVEIYDYTKTGSHLMSSWQK